MADNFTPRVKALYEKMGAVSFAMAKAIMKSGRVQSATSALWSTTTSNPPLGNHTLKQAGLPKAF
jgi:hypothetical protein